MHDTPFLMYSFLSDTYYENIDNYKPSNEYSDTARKNTPDDWEVVKKGFWTRCTPPAWSSVRHGWKIHVSSVPKNAIETIEIVAKILVEAKVAFKFCSDPRMLRMSISKSWSRFQAGKFMAIYPRDADEFVRVMDALHGATRHLAGPHVLTDRAYLDSRVLYYRYGAHVGDFRITPYGHGVPGFVLEDGSWYEDIRGPSFRLPPGCVDPFAKTIEQGKDAAPGEVLLNNRFLVKGVIKFNATGGIYFGIDKQSGREIIIREVRGMLGHLESERPEDPAFVLKREARILEKLSPTGLVPEFVDIFQEWSNWFLVEERLKATSLWGHSMSFYYSDEYQSSNFGLERILSTIKAIAEGLEVIHHHGIVLRDLTRNNVMFTDDGRVKFIDLEFAYELEGTEQWVSGWTPGYASAEQVAAQRPALADDHYALGALVLDMLTFCAAGMDLDRRAIFSKLEQVLTDLHLPMQLYDLAAGLTHVDREQRWDTRKALAFLAEIRSSPAEVLMFPAKDDFLDIGAPTPLLLGQLAEVEEGLIRFLESSKDLSRDDRLWPCSPEVFLTNPVSIQYGAAGVAWLLHRSRGQVDSNILDWLVEKARTTSCPPGLYAGLGGVALLLLSAGRPEEAVKLLDQVAQSEQTFSLPGLYFGCAGFGLVNLHFWHATGDQKYLDAAINVGQRLLAESQQSPHGTYWSSENRIYLGLGDGQSGIALFLLYLGAICADPRFIEAAGASLKFDVAHGIRVAGRICWKTHVDSKDNEPNVPHTRFGSAGIGTVCIRYFALTGDKWFRDVALDCAQSIRSRVTNKIWQDSGNAGYGEFLLDLAQFLGEESYRHAAYYHAEAILPHALHVPDGIAFAGSDHYRICCDYSTGSAGIGVFIDRLLCGKSRFMMLDEAVPQFRRGASSPIGCVG